MKWPFTLAVSKGVHIKSTDILPHVPCSGQSNLYSLVVAMACHRDSLVLCLLVDHFMPQIWQWLCSQFLFLVLIVGRSIRGSFLSVGLHFICLSQKLSSQSHSLYDPELLCTGPMFPRSISLIHHTINNPKPLSDKHQPAPSTFAWQAV